MIRPLIGITGRQGTIGAGSPQSFESVGTDVHVTAFAESVAATGGIPVQLNPVSDTAELARSMDGVLLSGGNDVDPRSYGSTPGPHATNVDPARDAFETRLLFAAMERRRPVLGICRGTQLVNVALGGTLVPDLPPDSGEAHSFFGYPPEHRSHEITTEPGSLIAGLLGETPRVNSFHHQAVDRPGRGLHVTARAADGVAEAVEDDSGLVLGVQWHPEFFAQPDPIFTWLVTSVRQLEGAP